MNLQYISDSNGKTAGVFIPIQDWDTIINRLNHSEKNEIDELPEWQKELVRKRIKKNKNNPKNYFNWEELEKQIKL